jgi:hypothetical protein
MMLGKIGNKIDIDFYTYLYNFGTITGKCGASCCPAFLAMEPNPKAAPFFEFQMAL